jgi:hypothetical protein
MATHHVTVTLGSGATPILTPSAGQSSKNVLEVQIESETGNAVVVCGGATVTASDYGASIPAGGGTANRLVIRTGGSRQINLATIYLFGTASQKCHVLYHT